MVKQNYNSFLIFLIFLRYGTLPNKLPLIYFLQSVFPCTMYMFHVQLFNVFLWDNSSQAKFNVSSFW